MMSALGLAKKVLAMEVAGQSQIWTGGREGQGSYPKGSRKGKTVTNFYLENSPIFSYFREEKSWCMELKA